MRIRDLNWMQLEEYLSGDDRIVMPIGSTEQHADLSHESDNSLAERVSGEAAQPLGLPVETFVAVIRDLLDSLHAQGFRRLLIVNAHGGNTPAQSLVREWTADHADAQAVFHSWWVGPKVRDVALAIDPDYSHANWGENFPWTRLVGVDAPVESKPMMDESAYLVAGPELP